MEDTGSGRPAQAARGRGGERAPAATGGSASLPRPRTGGQRPERTTTSFFDTVAPLAVNR